ncbi:MAG TPA: DUF5110 domain-containing protein, partial [Chitinophagaceae bacterium]
MNGNSETPKEFPIYQLPVYIKASSIIPVQSLVQSTKDKPSDTLYVHIYNGGEKNIFIYYEDDGSTFSYKNGSYYRRTIEFDGPKKEIVFNEQQGTYNSTFKYLQLILHGFDQTIKNISVSGQQYPVNDMQAGLFNPLDNLDDVYDKDYYKSLMDVSPPPQVKTITLANSSKAINITW